MTQLVTAANITDFFPALTAPSVTHKSSSNLRAASFEHQQMMKAFKIANRVHKGVLRRDGTPYISHPLRVAKILKETGHGLVCCASGLLHDVPEDHKDGYKKASVLIAKELSPRIADKVVKICLDLHKDLTKAEDLSGDSLRVKLADRADNMETLDYLIGLNNEDRIEKQKKKIRTVFESLIPKLLDEKSTNSDRLLINRVIQAAEKLFSVKHSTIFGIDFIEELRLKIQELETRNNTLVLA